MLINEMEDKHFANNMVIYVE